MRSKLVPEYLEHFIQGTVASDDLMHHSEHPLLEGEIVHRIHLLVMEGRVPGVAPVWIHRQVPIVPNALQNQLVLHQLCSELHP